MSRVLALVLASVLASACSVQSTQSEILRSVLPNGSEDIDQFAWRMQFNGVEALVYAVVVQDGIVFTNRDGLQIGFDGWDVVFVTGLSGAIGDVRVRKQSGEEGPRTHLIAGVGDFEVDCASPRRDAPGWITECVHRSGEEVFVLKQRLKLDAAGGVVRIESYIVPGAGPMILHPVGEA